MGTPLRVLIVEDSESDAGLIARQLKKAGYDLRYDRVETAEEMRTALAQQDWDLIIADYNLPRFSGPEALEILKARGGDIPFIVVSAAIGEEIAVGMMKAGAHDYVMKNNLARLAPAVARELREAAGRRERLRAEAALIKSEATMSTILKGSPNGIGLVVNRVFQWVNDRLLEMTGYSREELIGRSARLLYPSEAEFNRVGQVKFDQILKTGLGAVNTQWCLKNGSLMEVFLSSVAVKPHDLSAGVVFTAMDITERKRTEEARRVTHERLELALKGGDLGTWDWNIETGAVTFDERWAEMLGYRLNEVEPHINSWKKLVHPEDLPAVMEVLNAHLKGKTPLYETEYRLHQKSGGWVWVLDKGRVIERDAAGQAVRACGTHLDITARKQAEQNLMEQAAFRAAVIDNTAEGLCVCHDISEFPFVRFTVWNQRMTEITGYNMEEINRLGWYQTIYPEPELQARAVERMARMRRGDNLRGEEWEITRADGVRRMLSISTSVLAGAPGGGHVLALMLDITERKLTIKAIQESRQEWEDIFQAIGQPTLIMDASHRILMANRATLAAVGMTKEEVLGKRCYEIYHPEANQPPLGCPLEELLASGNMEQMEMEMAALGGTFMVSCTPMKNLDGSLEKVIHIATNITAQKQAEEELRLAAQKWRTTFDAMRDAVCLLDREGVIVQCNQAMVDLMEQPFPEIIGHSCWEVICRTSAPTEECPLCRLRHGRGRETLTWKRGDRWWHVMMDPILNEAGEVVGGVYIIVDITERKLSQDKIRDLNILLRAIKDINESLLRVKSEKELFQRTCDLLLMVPYIRFCWIGLVKPHSFEIDPVAWAGAEEGYLSTIKVTWDDSELGQGPTGEGLRTRKPILRRNIATDPTPNPWRQEAIKRGYQSSISLPLIHEGLVVGILKVYSGVPDIFGDEEIDFLNQVAGDIAVGVKSLRLEQEVIQSLIKIQVIMIQTVEAIGAILEVRDPYTAGHQQSVTKLAYALGNKLNLSTDQLEGLRVAGLLHDLGKIVVPAEILNKPGKLSEFEMQIIKTHPKAGYEILKKISFPWPVAQIVLQHHERLNGSGYPHGLAGQDILLEARILAVADVVEAMSAHRPYRPALGLEKALIEITEKRGVHFDPEVVDLCIKLFQENGFNLD